MKPQRKTVRANALVKALEQQGHDTTDAMVHALTNYHNRYVAPLEARLGYLETPRWRRLWHRLTGRWV